MSVAIVCITIYSCVLLTFGSTLKKERLQSDKPKNKTKKHQMNHVAIYSLIPPKKKVQ